MVWRFTRREMIGSATSLSVVTLMANANTPASAIEGRGASTPTKSAEMEKTLTAPTLTRELYEAFQRVEFNRWDAIIADDVLLNSPAGRDVKGLKTLKDFAVQFTDLAYRIDLIDEHLALGEQGSGRGFITFMLNWKHTKNFAGLAPTGREGTSVETMLLTIRNRKIVRIDVADNTLDLAIYEWQRGWPIPHNVRPEPITVGIDRRVAQ
jgi:hypothetical protein